MATTAFNLILGPMEIGNSFNLILFGVLAVQSYNYFSTFDDPKWLKWSIAFILFLDTLQTAVMMWMVWDFTVTHFMDPAHLGVAGWALSSIPFYSVPISWIVQGFFAWRIYQLTDKSLIIPVIVVVLSVVQGLAGLGAGIGAFLVTNTADFPKLQPVALIWFVGSIACDALITITMVIVLSRSRTGFQATDTLITKIIRSVVETGLATTTIVILDSIFFFRLGHTNMHLSMVIIAGKTYSNSMLYTLNSRGTMRKTGSARNGRNGVTGSSIADSYTMTELVFTNPQLKSGAADGTTSHVMGSQRSRVVNVDSETVIVADAMPKGRQSRRGSLQDDDVEGQYSLDERDDKGVTLRDLPPQEHAVAFV